MIEIKLSGNDAQKWIDGEEKHADQIKDLLNVKDSLEEELRELKDDVTYIDDGDF